MSTARAIDTLDQIPRLLFSRRSAAKALDISVRMIDYAIAAGRLQTRRVNSRILISADSLAQFAAVDQAIPRSREVGQESI